MQKLENKYGKDDLIFEPEFLYNSIKNGNYIVLDNINEAPSKVIERLIGLLDKKNNEKENYFEVQENSKNPKLKIHRHFRIISTSNFDKISQISPAFLSRFQAITLENQISLKNVEGIKNLISILANKYQYEYYVNHKKIKKFSQKK